MTKRGHRVWEAVYASEFVRCLAEAKRMRMALTNDALACFADRSIRVADDEDQRINPRRPASRFRRRSS
jgi:hypothetical protein